MHQLSPMGQAALQIARRGWPVFPCRERDEAWRNAAGKGGVFKAKAPYTGKGLKDATTQTDRITSWWRQHPDAMIGVPMGVNGCFALDFDPRIEDVVDEATGEITGTREWTLEELKAALEAQMGVALPPSLTSRTQSGGVHVWYRQPDDGGPPIRNRGNLPDHVDVRGEGGYVVAPPSKLFDAEGVLRGEYRWIGRRGDWRDEDALMPAPAELIEILRAPKAKAQPEAPSARGVARSTAAADSLAVDDAVRKYALAALDGECSEIRRALSGRRNAQLNEAAFKVATLVAAGALDAAIARVSVEAAARDNPGNDDDRQLGATIDSGWTAGLNSPRDLAEVAAAARSRRDRGPPRGASRSSPPRPDTDDDGQPSSQTGGRGDHDGGIGGGGGEDHELTRECAFLPQTDLGNLQRFLRRYGRNFLFVEQWGWLAWDGKRWNRDMAVPLLGRAVQDTMRAIQDEAEMVRASGVPVPANMFENYDAAQLLAHEAQQKRKLDRIIKPATSKSDAVLLSDTIGKWGRTSEGAGHIACIAKMAEARRSARPDDFDADPLLFNVTNGTIVFERGADGATAFLRPHRREDRITKIAAVEHDSAAKCPRYDAFLAEVQPKEDMQAFLDCWGGYNLLGLADAQKMALYYGQGSNGKSVDVDTKAFIMGDYARVCGIETFIDQGKYRKGSDATPDLAALAGRRMVRASEPEDGSKFSDGLIKAMTGSEPVPVRELMKPPFEMSVTFKVTVSANNKPKIGTDHGIQRRMQLVPWDVIIPDDRQDTQLTAKLKAEGSGILNRLIAGACAYLDSGLPVPDAVREATREYQEENDLLGQFLALCIEKRAGDTLGATVLHKLFSAWQAWSQNLGATGKPWSPKYLNAQMQKRGFKVRKSSSMLWDDIAALYDETDFVGDTGLPRTGELPPPRGRSPAPPHDDYIDDDLPP